MLYEQFDGMSALWTLNMTYRGLYFHHPLIFLLRRYVSIYETDVFF